ncbi:Retrotransposon protein [Nesidiocoris tenuis]|uniref:Retrotransposon protein n=1 Tax=Nesidiocoris tenuis TaxID=355587 RepID=A0ABN7BE72_9HEMI|nr:Retrotransposon protein [Nesidiocoris tenuis]
MHALFGGEMAGVKTHQCYRIRLEDVWGQLACNFEVLDSEAICHSVPSVPKGPWLAELEKREIMISDVRDGPIDILIGADVAGKLFTGREEVLSNGLVAMETNLGWTVMGRVRQPNSNFMMNVESMCSIDLSPSELWNLDVIGIREPADRDSTEEMKTAVQENFLKTVKILDNGRYEVCLPWLPGHRPLGRSFHLAMNRLNATYRRLQSSGLLSDYDGVLKEWLEDGVIERMPDEDWDRGQ